MSSVKLLSVQADVNELQYSVDSTGKGASTGKLKFGGQLESDYTNGLLRFVDGTDGFEIPFSGKSQIELAEETFSSLAEIKNVSNFDRSKITNTDTLVFDQISAKQYLNLQTRMYKLLDNFH